MADLVDLSNERLTLLSNLLNFLALEIAVYVLLVFYERFGKNGHPVSILGQVGAGLAVIRCGLELLGGFILQINCTPLAQTILYPVGQVSMAFLYAHFLYKRRLIHGAHEKWQVVEGLTALFIIVGYLIPAVVTFVITVEFRVDSDVPAGEFGSSECPMGWVPGWMPVLSYILTIIANSLTTFLFVSLLHTEGQLLNVEYMKLGRLRRLLRLLDLHKQPWESHERYLARRTFLASLASVSTTLLIVLLFLTVLPVPLYTSFALLDLSFSWCWATLALPLPREEKYASERASGSTINLRSFVDTGRMKRAVGIRSRAGTSNA